MPYRITLLLALALLTACQGEVPAEGDQNTVTLLFTNDVERARHFYQRVFGWDWRVVTHQPHHYGLLYNDGVAVAGIAYRGATDGEGEYGRWLRGLPLTVVVVDRTTRFFSMTVSASNAAFSLARWACRPRAITATAACRTCTGLPDCSVISPAIPSGR